MTTTIILAYTFKLSDGPDDIEDHWDCYHDMEEAQAAYQELLARDDLYMAHICGVINGTDYDTYQGESK